MMLIFTIFSNLEFDLNVNNTVGIRNTFLLRAYAYGGLESSLKQGRWKSLGGFLHCLTLFFSRSKDKTDDPGREEMGTASSNQ